MHKVPTKGVKVNKKDTEKGEKRPPCRQRKTRIREILPDVASNEGEKRDVP